MGVVMHTQNQMPRYLGSLLLKSRSGTRQWPPPALTQQVLSRQAPIEPSLVTTLIKRQQGRPLWRTSRHGAQIACLLLAGWFAQPQFANANQVASGNQYLSASINVTQQSASMTATVTPVPFPVTSASSRSACKCGVGR